MMNLQTITSYWAEQAIPERTPMSGLQKLSFEEIPELVQCVTKHEDASEELADCMILLLDIATLLDVDVELAVSKKLQDNRSRTWIRNAETGFFNHT